jgi:hypothetical protein
MELRPGPKFLFIFNDSSIGNWIVGFDYSYPMICELEVHLWQFYFRHMALRTQLLTHWTGSRRAAGRLGVARSGEMTGQAFRVIESRVTLQLIMWVMAGHTIDAGIALMPSTIEYSVGLKTHVVEAGLPRHNHHLVEASVTGAAEFLRQIVRIHLPRIKDSQLFELTSFDRSNVFFARTMTGFTGHPWD